ncbi:DEKNAAC102093 [Brettanomyces naardenensis]|uniref:DNA polymerase alpha subunit B n=1 Tax=Brettanomyces naardenensis TaxID=13370 RepID=A0A448YJR3_BRENA|nr:DEKNAAC102093 [Brettanomyces naardenensis]
MSVSIGAQIVEKFGPKADQPDILKKCEDLMELFGLTAEELFLKWETYVVTSSTIDDDMPLTANNLSRLQEYIQKKIVKDNQKTPSTNHVKRPVIRATPNVSMTNVLPSTPMSLKKRRKLETPYSSDTSHLRGSDDSSFITARSSSPIRSSDLESTPSGHGKSTQESGSILETLNRDVIELTDVKTEADTATKLRLVANFDPSKYKFRTMNQKLLEVADYLDDQIDTVAKIVLDHYHFDQSEFGNPNLQSQTGILTVGRIVPDSPLTEFDADLNSNSLFLETSRSGGIGQRICLDVKDLDDYSFFPGQIVCLRGINQTGDVFKVSHQYELPYLGAPVSTLDDLKAYQEQLSGENMKVVVTAGPYSPSRELNFDLLSKFVDRMNEEVHPNAIIMFGPFLDINHKQIRDGTLSFADLEREPKTLDEVFKMVIAPILRRLNCRQVIIIPSTKDATTDHAAYPQEMFDRKGLGLSKNFKCFPNPATFSLNEVLIGCSNNDIFRDLKDVNSGRYVGESRFNRVSEHVLEQRRFYPSFPGGIKRQRGSLLVAEDRQNQDELFLSGADLHVSYMGLTEFPDSLPDVLVIPSELKYFAKVVKNVLVINPGSFVKMNSNGTYALMNARPPVVEDLQKIGEDLYLNDIWKRARVDIVRS